MKKVQFPSAADARATAAAYNAQHTGSAPLKAKGATLEVPQKALHAVAELGKQHHLDLAQFGAALGRGPADPVGSANPATIVAGASVNASLGVQDQLLDREKRGIAVIDCGSSSAKMLIIKWGADGKPTTVSNVKISTELGRNVGADHKIPEANQQRAIDAVKSFVEQAKQLGIPAGEITMMATAVVRNAKADGLAFAERVHTETGLGSVRVLTEKQEAEMGFLGATAAFAGQGIKSFATLDLGGGSFQLAVGNASKMEKGASTEVGSNFVQEKLLPSGLITPQDFASADKRLLKEAPLPLPAELLNGRTLVATGGVSLFLRAHFHSDFITREQIDALRVEVGAIPVEKRGAMLQVGKDDLALKALGIDTPEGATDYGKKLPASATLLLRIMDGLGQKELHVSQTDNRNALVNSVRKQLHADASATH